MGITENNIRIIYLIVKIKQHKGESQTNNSKVWNWKAHKEKIGNMVKYKEQQVILSCCSSGSSIILSLRA